MTCILGLNAYHGDASACLLRDGVLVAAAEVEDRVYFLHSLGIFYQALTQFIGFPNY